MATSCLPAFAAEDSASLMIATFQHRLAHSMPSGSPSEACLESCFTARYLQSWGLQKAPLSPHFLPLGRFHYESARAKQ